jgi:DNA-binding transcriptional LysR family regulator
MPFFGNLVSAFRSARPRVRVTLHELSSRDQFIALQARELDAAILRNPPRRFATDISLTRLTADPLVIADLRDKSIVNYPRQSGVGIYEQVIALCAQRGFTPRVVQEDSTRGLPAHPSRRHERHVEHIPAHRSSLSHPSMR